MLVDQHQREKATDPTESFIIQAPAGSGKTELLTQRFLRLLATVHAPEQIIALTFTRKAASEMRERILTALNRAKTAEHNVNAHQQATYNYARAALDRSKQLGWRLLKQPNRLKIITIDALCQQLSRAIPLYEQWVPYASISDDIGSLYRDAVRACLQDILKDPEWEADLTILLTHLDNRQDKLIKLLCQVLANRDQWLPLIFAARQQTRQDFEQALALIEQHELSRFIACIPSVEKHELFALCGALCQLESIHNSPRSALLDWQDIDRLDRDIAGGLAALVLTKDNKLRKGFDHHVGLKREYCENKIIFDELKQRSRDLLTNIAKLPEFLPALIRVKSLPPPRYTDEQWQMLKIIFRLFPLLASHLQLLFRYTNSVDFTDITQQALMALGNEDSPTDLALYLDHNIHHLLIDEFQDTSIPQYNLIKQLVSGWLPDQGKTLFLVGDPMQSIYRFRQAEVGLFIKAKQQGIGEVPLTFLELSCNFRSTPTIIHWINHTFQAIFPQLNDMESGAIAFSPSAIGRPDVEDASCIQALTFTEKKLEASYITQLVSEKLNEFPEETIAVLVRSRNQLSELLPLLRAKNLPYQGVDIEKLTAVPLIADIWTLTQALLMPANRLAWLALLRSPLCGLTLSDLYIVANYDKHESITYALNSFDKLTGLSDDGRQRLAYITPIMQNALINRQQQPLLDWLNTVLQQLHGDKILTHDEQHDLAQFWQLLAKFTKNRLLPDLVLLERELEQHYSQKLTQSRLQIMTIHKSKGLEFDTVILPGLGSRKPASDKPLLRWLQLPSTNEQPLFLLSPILSAFEEHDYLYHYLGQLSDEKERYEQQRLLYVAGTRAKKRLYLTDYKENVSTNTFRELLRNQTFELLELEPELNVISAPLLARLPLSYYQIEAQLPKKTNTHPEVMPTINRSKHLGIIAHELLQWMSLHHQIAIDALPWRLIRNRCLSLGFSLNEQADAIEELTRWITQLIEQPLGQWLFKQHIYEKNEYELLLNSNGQVETNIIDKILIEDDILWIIEYKTGKDDALAQQDHYKQVQHYAELLASMHPNSIRCGIYYLASAQWLTWEYTKNTLAEISGTIA